MEITPEFIEELVTHTMKIAKLHREQAGFSGSFAPLAIVVGPEGQQVRQPTPYHSRKEKQAMMQAISLTARSFGAVAILLVSDTRYVKCDDFTKRFNLPEDLSWDEWQQHYVEILDKHFGGEMANLPITLLTDAMVVAIKGPLVETKSYFLPYHEGVGDSVRWDDPDPHHDAQILMLEDWWDATPAN
jgi:hypothetical protein